MGSLTQPGATRATGDIFGHGAPTPPPGCIKANGPLLNKAAYAALWAWAQAAGMVKAAGQWSAGTAYYEDVDGTSFRAPDLRAEFMRYADDGRGVDPGRAIGTAQADEFKSHTHGYSWHSASGSTHPDGGANYGTQTLQSGAAGGTETRPRNVAMLACIKY